MSDEELETGSDLTISEAKKLKKGFVIINDISKMKPASPQGTEYIKKAQKFVIQNGAAKIIRVTDNPVVKMQFERTESSAGYEAIEVKTFEEALALV